LTARTTRLAQILPEQQLLWQLAVSAPVLLLVSAGFGPALRDLQEIHIAGLLFQSTAVACFGFLAWFWLLKQYPTSGVASFSFLSPVFAVIMGWLFLGEQIGLEIYIALGLVCLGLILINKKPAGHRPAEAGEDD
jgi:drug/metabolite transporter (DMT)-like permease